MMKLASILITWLFVFASPALGVTGADLGRWCTEDEPSTCTGFLLGTVASLTTLQNWKKVKRNFICLPPSITEQQLREMVMMELSNHPDLNSLSASSVALNALLKNFPCK